MSELAIAWPRLPGAEQGDVVLARGAQDLADLRDQRVDVVADAALAELAEARQVAADLGRVDVRVVGELLRGDRLLAHLARLGQDLEVARQPRRDAEREAVAVRQGQLLRRVLGHAASSVIGISKLAPVDRSSPDSIEPRPQRVEVELELGDDLAVDRDHRDPLEVAGAAGRRRARCRPRGARTAAPRRAAPRAPRAPRRRGGSRASCRASRPSCQGVEAQVVRIRRRLEEAGRRGDHRRVVGAELGAARASAAGRAPRTARPTRSRSTELAATPPPSATASHSPAAERLLELGDQLADDRRLEAGGEVGAAPLDLACVQLADRVEERRLQAAEAEVEARVARHRDREVERRRDRPRAPGARSPGRPDSRARAGARPCRAPRRPRRRASGRAPRSRRAPRPRRAACGRRSRSGTGTAARAARARGSWPRRGRAGGRPRPAACGSRRPAPWRW